MAIQYTPFPIATSDGRTVQVKTAINLNSPSTPPTIVDRNNNVLFQWSITNRNWEPLGSSTETLPLNSGFSSTETYGSLLNTSTRTSGSRTLVSNERIFTDNTTRVINKLPPNQKSGFASANSYQPYNTFVNRQQQTSQQQPPQQGSTPTAQQLPSPGSGATSTPGSSANPVGNISASANRIRVAPNNGLRYPEDIGSSLQDRILFQALELVERTGAGTGERLQFTFGEPKYNSVDGPVYLAIQAPISDQNSAEWGPDSVNAIQSAAYHASMQLMGEGEGRVGDALKNLYENLYKTGSEQQGRIQRYFGGQAASINNILARTDNVVLNPNMELLFSGPQLRPFNFQFKMSARDQAEANMIKNIIKYFKYHSAVRKEEGLFLKAPDVFKIQYQYGNSNNAHPGINLIKTCALTNFSVDYTPLGSYMTYQDGTMVAYALSMQFQELTPIYDTDYNYNHQIGF